MDNAVDNAEDNAVDNAEDNVEDNAEDNAVYNAEDNAEDNTEDNAVDNAEGVQSVQVLERVGVVRLNEFQFQVFLLGDFHEQKKVGGDRGKIVFLKFEFYA